MKTILATALAFLAFFPAFTQGQKIVKGSGYVLTQQRETPVFTAIEASQSIRVFISRGESQPLTVEADDNLLTYIKTEVKNNILRVYIQEGISIRKYADLNVLVILPQISSLSATTSARIESVTEPWQPQNIELNASTSGKIKLHLETNEIKIKETTGADIELKGSANQLDASLTTAAQLKAQQLKVKYAKLNLTTGAEAEVEVSEGINCDLSTGSKLIYKGEPNISSSNVTTGARVIKNK